MIVADFATRLRQLRKERKLRQVDLAGHLGLAQTTIANYEQHSRFPDEETLRKVANFFDVSLDYLLGRTSINLEPAHLLEYSDTKQTGGGDLSPLAAKYLTTLMGGDKRGATEMIMESVRRGTDVRTIYLEVFEPALKELGRLWEINEIDVSVEHFFSETTQAIMSQLYPHLSHATVRRGTVVAVAVGGELHQIGIRMLSDLLEDSGWYTYYLGVNIPTTSIDRALRDRGADVLAISATMSFNVDSVANMIGHIRHAIQAGEVPAVKIVVGGQAFDLDKELWRRVGADGTAPNAEEAIRLLEWLVHGTERAS